MYTLPSIRCQPSVRKKEDTEGLTLANYISLFVGCPAQVEIRVAEVIKFLQ